MPSATLVAFTVPPKSFEAPDRFTPPDPFTVNAVVPSLAIVLPGA